MKRLNLPLVCVCACLQMAPSLAQEFPDLPAPTKDHEFLQKFAGKWTVDQEARMSPDQPPIKGTGSIESHMLGKFWVINEFESSMLGMTMTGIQTVGYDSAKKMYVGTWVDSMTETLWHYEGSVDESGMILTLSADGPHMSKPGETAKYRDIYEFKSKDEIAVFSKVLSDDGEWVTFMQGTATRVKK